MTEPLTATWRDEPVRPDSYEDVAALVKLAPQARQRTVDFDWHLTPDELLRLREAVHFWGSAVQGRYKAFDAQVLAAINDVLEESDSVYHLEVPGRGADESEAQAEAHDTGYRLCGHASFDLIFGYGHAAHQPEHRLRLGEELADKLRRSVDDLGWDTLRLSLPELQPVVNVLFGLPTNYGIEEQPTEPQGPADTIDVAFHGPFSVIRDGGDPLLFDAPVAEDSGIYLWTFPVEGTEHAHYVGQTRRHFATRLSEHLAGIVSGQYEVLDPDALARGQQKLVWRAPPSPASYGAALSEFLQRMDELRPVIHKLLAQFRIHVAPLSVENRQLDRIEGGIGRHFLNHPDDRIRRMFAAGAKLPAAIPFETPLRCRIAVADRIAGFPDEVMA